MIKIRTLAGSIVTSTPLKSFNIGNDHIEERMCYNTIA